MADALFDTTADALTAWRENERADKLDLQRKEWVAAAWRLQELIAGLEPAGGHYLATTCRPCGSLGCRDDWHHTGVAELTPAQVATLVQAEIDSASRACRRLQQQYERRLAASKGGVS